MSRKEAVMEILKSILFGLIEGLPPEECMRKGAANAAETLQYWGSW